MSMYGTSTRPATVEFSLPPSPATVSGIDFRRDTGLHFVPQFTPPYSEGSLTEGHRTPPLEDMTATYRNPQYNIYGGRQDGTYVRTNSSGNSYTGIYSSDANTQPKSNTSLGQLPPASNSALRHDTQASLALERPPSPPAAKSHCPEDSDNVPRQKATSSDTITPNMQIPLSINCSGGSLAEFAAQITCLFWFESTEALKSAELQLPSSCPIKRLRDEAIPSSGFRKWVVTILSTTQVTQNVIILALLFIYRLKTINPAVKGRSGSEYRLLTVALMLGNKFLDDNTYTNKTWAEVSGISVTEIHVMEVEFLSNMRYSLLASKEQWQEWQKKLGKFSTYCDRASKAPVPPPPQPTLNHQPPLPLPSPPNSMHASPPSVAGVYPVTYVQSWPAPHYTPTVSPLSNMPELNFRQARKRSLDSDADEPTPKRVTRSAVSGTTAYTTALPPLRRQDAPRLPVPSLTISTTQPYSSAPGPTSFAPSVPLLPLPHSRAMSTVYPTTPTWPSQLPVITPTGPPSQSGPLSAGAGGYVTPSRRQSPHSVHDLLSLGSSPISGNFSDQPSGLISPSFYLQQRASPYKPVRHVNALLYPPPSTSMHDYSMSVGEMHYQPLGKRHDMRPGVVPDYAYHLSYQPWRLPQPNFHS